MINRSGRIFLSRRALLVLAALGALALTATAAAPARRAVTIEGMKFEPATLEVRVGDSVRWTNNDDRDHTVTATNGAFKSANLRSGDTFEHRFERVGKFPYSCSYHPRMKGTVNVVAD